MATLEISSLLQTKGKDTTNEREEIYFLSQRVLSVFAISIWQRAGALRPSVSSLLVCHKAPKNKPQSVVARKFINLMLTIDECKKILKNNNSDEVKMIREYLYLLANLQIESENNSFNIDSL